MRIDQIIAIIFLVVSSCLAFYFVFQSRESYSGSYSSYGSKGRGYNTYNRKKIKDALSYENKENMKLEEYINILNSTSDLKTLSLQELCNNPILDCDESEEIKTMEECIDFCKKVALQKMNECMEKRDWYHLSLIMLKIFDFLSFFGDQRGFERSPTNGIYGSESIRMLMNGEPLLVSQIPIVPKTEKNKYDKECFQAVENMIQCSKDSYEKSNSSTITVEMFCKLGWVLLRDIVDTV